MHICILDRFIFFFDSLVEMPEKRRDKVRTEANVRFMYVLDHKRDSRREKEKERCIRCHGYSHE